MAASSDDISRTLAQGQPKRRRWLWLGLVALLAAGAGGWVWRAEAARQAVVPYVTEAVTRGPLVVSVTATGTVQPTTEVAVSSELSGTLTMVGADFNDTVEVGQVLAQLDDTKLKAQVANAEASLLGAQARVEQADATQREADENYKAQSALDARGVSTKRDLVGYEAAFQRARAEIDIAKADQTLAEANLTLQQADLAKAVIRSPIKGVVLDRTADVGQIVASSLNTPTLFKLAGDLSRMQLLVDIDEADIGRVAVGNVAAFTVDAYPGRSFPATITQVRFAPETTDGVVTYKAVLSVDNADLLLRPGMTATATITVSRVEDALLVPNAALRFAPPQVASGSKRSGAGLLGLILPRRPERAVSTALPGTHVWVLTGGEAREVAVVAGDTDGQMTAITGGDLAVGGRVITDQGEAG